MKEYTYYFSFFFSLILIFAIKIINISLQEPIKKYSAHNSQSVNFFRNDITDRNGILLARNIKVYNAAVRPELIKDKKKFLIKLKLIYPDIDKNYINKKFKKNKYFYLKKNISEEERLKLWSLGEKGILFEKSQTRIYPHKNLFSHVIGQTDSDNFGISGIEKLLIKN